MSPEIYFQVLHSTTQVQMRIKYETAVEGKLHKSCPVRKTIYDQKQLGPSQKIRIDRLIYSVDAT